MNVLLLNPPRFERIPVIREERCEITERYSVLPPYSLLQIGGILRERGHEVSLIDANGFDLNWSETEELIRKSSYDALVFRFTPTTFDADMRAAHISKQIRPEASTAAICWTLHTVPREVMKESAGLDLYIIHEYEVVAPALLEALSSGRSLDDIRGIAYRKGDETVVNAPAEPIKSYDDLPLPAFDLVPSLEPYHINVPHGKPFTIMYASKGCPFSCTFCTVRRTPFKRRSAESILRELRYLKSHFRLRTVSFFDETFTIDKNRVLQLCEQIQNEDLNIKWYCNTRVELVTKDMLRTMRRGGCRGVAYGIETGSQEILQSVAKGNRVEDAEAAIRWTKEAGIKAYCSFIIGLPGENWDTIRETIRFVKRTRPTGAQFNVAVPYPGTPMYDLAVEKGWVKSSPKWRELYQHAANMRTESLGQQELERARELAYRSLYFDPKWIMGNVYWVLKYPEDLLLGVRYFFKIMNNYLVHQMRHAH